MPNFFDQYESTAQPTDDSGAPRANFFDQFEPGYKPPEGPGDFMRGAKVAIGQTVPIAKGVIGLAGASAEKAFGEGGISTAVKNWGLQGYQAGMDKLQPLQKDTDELTTAWDKAKGGDMGALVDWVQYGLGYAVGQGGEALLTSLIGGVAGGAASGGLGAAPGAIAGLVGKGAVKDVAQGLIQRAVLKEANAVMAAQAGKLTAEEAVKQATKTVAKNIGSTSALLAYGTGQELGSIYPEAEAEAAKKGERLSGGDLARVWATGLAAGGIEALTDKLGIDVAMGKVKFPGAQSRIGSAALTGAAGALTEGATEGVQTAIERVGAGQDVLSPEGIKDIVNSAGLGAVGGGAIGGGAGLLHGGHHGNPAAVQASNQAMDDLANATGPDAAIEAFNRTHVPLQAPAAPDTAGAVARLAQSDTTLPDVTNVPTPDVLGDEFQGRLGAVSEQLKDSRVRQAIRDRLGPTALADAMHYSQNAANDALPGRTSDQMLARAESILRASTMPEPETGMAPRTPSSEPVIIDAANAPNAVAQYVDKQRTENTPAARAFVQMFDAGKITNADVAELITPRPAEAEPVIPASAPVAQPTGLVDSRGQPLSSTTPLSLKERAAASAERQKPATAPKTAMQEAFAKAEAQTVDEAAHAAAPSPNNDLAEPTEAQAKAGNYAKGHVRVAGMDISVENPEGSTRSGTDSDGKAWTSTIKSAHYGYIRGTVGMDKEHVDAFVKPGTTTDHAGTVFVVDQIDPKTGKADEHKALIGFDTIEEARAAYQANYAKDWKGLKTISATPMAEFKQWLATGDTTKPFHQPTLKERAQAMSERSKTKPTEETKGFHPETVSSLELGGTKGFTPETVSSGETLSPSKKSAPTDAGVGRTEASKSPSEETSPGQPEAAVAQAEAPKESLANGVPEGAPKDIVSKRGTPFATMGAAMRALGEAGEATHEIKRVEGGLVVREKPKAEPKPAASTGTVGAVTTMIEEGDFRAATDYAEAKGVSLDDLKLSKADRAKLDEWQQANPPAEETSTRAGSGVVGQITNPDNAINPLPETIYASVDSGTKAATWMQENAADPEHRAMAEKLAPFLSKGVSVQWLKAGDKAPATVARRLAGTAAAVTELKSDGTFAIYMRTGKAINETLLLHELIHAATMRALEGTGNVLLRAEMQNTLAAIRNSLTEAEYTSAIDMVSREEAAFFQRVLTDEDELLAYAFSSPTLRKWLGNMNAQGKFTKFERSPNYLREKAERNEAAIDTPTLWQRFLDAISGLLGFEKSYQKQYEQMMADADARVEATVEASRDDGLFDQLDQYLNRAMEAQAKMDDAATSSLAPGVTEVVRTLRTMDQQQARNLFVDAITKDGHINLWQRTIGTQYAKAEANPTTFKPVFEAVQNYLKDNTVFANAAADRAPDILPKLDRTSDLWKDGLLEHGAKREDIDAAGQAAFDGTLNWTRDASGQLVNIDKVTSKAESMDAEAKARELFKGGFVTEAQLKSWQALPIASYEGAVRNRYEDSFLKPGVVFSDAELAERFKATPKQIGLYKQFRAAIDQSLDDIGRSELLRLAGNTVSPQAAQQAQAADTMAQAAAILSADLDAQGNSDAGTALRNDINEKANQVQALKDKGYAPLMRFGEHTVTVAPKKGESDPQFFGMYETNTQANMAARALRQQFGDAAVTQGVMSKEGFKLFQGVDLNSLELFADATGNADNAVYQDYLRLAKNNRSAMKRMIHRKGIAGFNTNTSRVLASFLTSNARMASGNLHMGKALQAAEAIPKEMGDLKDEAVRLVSYVQSPKEEASALRGLLFTNFIGGSIASAAVNLTQPFTMTLPYLSQFGGIANASKHLLAAARAAGGGKINDEIAKAIHDNPDIVSPQEIHHLQAAAQDRLADHPMLKKAAFIWGSMFSLSEQFNRRVTFIAAFQTAKEHGMENPVEFARKAVIETQGLYNSGNKANWARGAIGATLFTFKQFSIHYLEFLTRMWKSGPEGKKAVGVALAIMVLTAGVGGLPFADDLDDLIDTLAQALGYDISSKKAKREFIATHLGSTAADFLTRGLSGISGMPIDVSLRMGMGNLIPGTGALLRSNTDRSKDVLEFAGAAGGLAKSAMDAGASVLKGDFAKAGMSMAPLAIQNMAKSAEMFNTGSYKDTRGRNVTSVDAMDAAAKFIGFQPGQVARESSRQQEVQRSIQLAKNVEGEISGKWAQGLAENRPDLVREARADLADWNAKNETSQMRIGMQQIINRVREMRSTRNERTVKAAPREMRQSVREQLQ